RSDAKGAGGLPYILRQTCLILLICAAILIPTMAPTTAQNPSGPTADFKLTQDSTPVTEINVFECEEFELNFYIDLTIPGGWGMTAFDALITWDPSQVEYVESVAIERTGWTVSIDESNVGSGSLLIDGELTDGSPFKEDAVWAIITFHCLVEGQSVITVGSPPGGTVWIGDGVTTPTPYTPDPYEVPCNQYIGPPPPRVVPVGGEVYSTDKLAVLAPYIALIGLASVVIMAVKRRRL
ncbi:MAG: hypothetical protein QXR65_08130, partial [Candidatus Bathyarchaeia archaeon]